MRPIQFRAFHRETKEMCVVLYIDFYEGKVLAVGKNKYYKSFYTSEAELMQFTGLYDKNGKEIYEGDVLKGNFHTPIQVYFSNGQFKANVIGKDKQGELTWHGDLLGRTEIIGNIHENKNLLEQ